MSSKYEKKSNYVSRLYEYLKSYNQIMIICVDNVQNSAMQKVRKALYGEADIIMGKNTLMKRAIKEYISNNEGSTLSKILPYITGNIGLVFCSGNLKNIKDIMTENRTPAPAKIGASAPCEVYIPAGLTGCEPGLTSFFQVLQVPTKITRGQIEIVNTFKLMSVGDKVLAGHAALLEKLGIKPFNYGIEIRWVYDQGNVFPSSILDVDENFLISKFSSHVNKLAALSIQLQYPTILSLPHDLSFTMKHLGALYVDRNLDYSFPEVQSFIDFFEDPSRFESQASAAGYISQDNTAAASTTNNQLEEEEEEESDFAVGGLFGDSDEDDD